VTPAPSKKEEKRGCVAAERKKEKTLRKRVQDMFRCSDSGREGRKYNAEAAEPAKEDQKSRNQFTRSCQGE